MTSAQALFTTGTGIRRNKSLRFYSWFRSDFGVTLFDIMVILMVVELVAGSVIYVQSLIEQRRIREQITQISKFNSAVGNFYEKYMGLPGDLISAQAERVGLPTGDGMPAHSDGDGKISPCSPGWKQGLGCETLLFWSQLAAAGIIDGSFTAAARYSDTRIPETDLLEHYVPQSTLLENMYIFVWNADNSGKMNNPNLLPGGNYFELTAASGINDGAIEDNPHSISPLIAREIDRKFDDGYPMSGNVVVNSFASDNDGQGWSAYAKEDNLECITERGVYNNRDYFKAHRPLCHLAIRLEDQE